MRGERFRKGWTYASDLAKDGSNVVLVVLAEDVRRLRVLERVDLLDGWAREEEPDMRKPTAITEPGVKAWRHRDVCQV